ncbi:BglG family transcription antiterminator [Streptococcus cuniculi]|uniref:HTH domain-containing protein n=1 Tax=Streptococcus cuniculi TaxID=1432788 RepID=A0A4Y9JBN8_9STRE|nr:PTS sugar transporter subunit IIA [Streptococcus cuniculi]MBF0778843.1 PTS sugar transporter subunit IIA [Streptococcus cuniculi]TFU97225.1 HTH domain-containing protein [Streptococcus cuniculi]
MNQRSKEILTMLLEKSKVPLTDITEIHEVSERTIRNDIASLNDYLANLDFGSMYIKRKHVILDLQVSKLAVYEDINKFDVYEYKFSSSERSLICLLILIAHRGYVTLNQLSEKLLASRSTIVNDVKIMRELAKKHHLKIFSKANKGYQLIAKEEDIRIFLYSILSQENFKVLNSLIFDEHYEEEIGFGELRNRLFAKRHLLHLSEKLLERVLQYLVISTYRNQKGFPLHTVFRAEESALFKELVKSFTGIIPQNDLAFICQQVSESNQAELLDELINKESIRIQVTVMKFIEKISTELHIDFKEDYIFYENFSAHILRMLRKEDFQGDISLNMEDIVRSNQKIQKVVRQYLPIIEENIGRKATQTEFHYMIIHVYAAMERKKRMGSNLRVAVLTEKKSTEVFFIESKLVSNFSFNLDIYSTDDTIRGEYDLILTTLPVQHESYVQISPFITDEDYIVIANAVNQIVAEKEYHDFRLDRDIALKLYQMISQEIDEESHSRQTLKEAIKDRMFTYVDSKQVVEEDKLLYEFLTADRILLDVEATDWRESIQKVGHILLERQEITAEYLDVVTGNIEEMGPYVVISNGFAFPHAQLGNYNKQTAMGLIRLAEPVYFDDEEQDNPHNIETLPVKYVCILSTTDRKKHLKAIFNLFNLLKDTKFKIALDACQTGEDIHRLIEEQEKRMELRR